MGMIRSIVYPNIAQNLMEVMRVVHPLTYLIAGLILAYHFAKLLYTRVSRLFYAAYWIFLISYVAYIGLYFRVVLSLWGQVSQAVMIQAILLIFIIPLLIAFGPVFYMYHRQLYADLLLLRLQSFGEGGSARFGGIGTLVRLFPNKIRPFIIGSFLGLNTQGVTSGRAVLLGRSVLADDPFSRYVCTSSIAHHVVIAGPRSGKKTCCILFDMVMRDMDTIVIGDPKGEITNETFIRRSCKASLEVRGITDYKTQYHFPTGWTFVLDSHGLTRFGGDRHTIIGEEEFSLNDPNAGQYLNAIVGAMVKPESDKNKFFEFHARTVLRGAIVHIKSIYPPEYHTLPMVYDLIMGIDEHGRSNPETFKVSLAEMLANPAFDGSAQASAKTLREASNDLKGSIMATVMRAITWINDPAMRAQLSGPSSFAYKDIGNTTYTDEQGKEQKAVHTIYITLSDGLIASHGQWLRCHAALSTVALRNRKKRPPCHVMIDEFAKLKSITEIKEGFSIAAGLNIQYTIYLQNIQQLKSAYKDWPLFFSGTNVRFFGVDDLETAKFIADWLGQWVKKRTDPSPSMIERPYVKNEQRVQLRSAQEVLSMLGKDSKYMIYFGADGTLPIRLERLVYKRLAIVPEGRVFNPLGLDGLKGHFEDH